MLHHRILVASSLVALGGCEFFHPTTVPSSDTSDPWAIVSLYFDGDHQEIRLGDMSIAQAASSEVFNHVTQDPYEGFIALAAGLDGGGVHRVEMHSRIFARCVYGPATAHVLEPWTVQQATRAAEPGETVQNGLYLYKGFSGIHWVEDLDFCTDDNYQVTLEWSSRAWDFHGNFAAYGLGKVTYVQFAG